MRGLQRLKEPLLEFGSFFTKQIQSSIFPLFLFSTHAVSKLWSAGLLRYDFILFACVLFQVWLVISKRESLREFTIVLAFHVVGLILETYKVTHGSWTYPDKGSLWVGPVPLFSGFMYAAVASYKIQAWRIFDLKFHQMPGIGSSLAVCALIYLNFFWARSIGDWRWLIVLAVGIVYSQAKVEFALRSHSLQMPMLVTFILIGFFIWVAENICSGLGAWVYPYQRDTWQMVDLGKLSSWSLMTVVSFTMIALHKNAFATVTSSEHKRV